jgi:hypothetical protein
MVPPAPVRFSTTKGWPICCESFSASMRPMMSDVVAGAKATIRRTGFDG